MHCPACRSSLQPHTFSEVEVDQCSHCEGVWLDSKEIDLLFQEENLPEQLVNASEDEQPLARVPEGHRTCPRCNIFLTLVEVDGIKLDVCSDCKGFFADRGEFQQLASAAERRYREQQ